MRHESYRMTGLLLNPQTLMLIFGKGASIKRLTNYKTVATEGDNNSDNLNLRF